MRCPRAAAPRPCSLTFRTLPSSSMAGSGAYAQRLRLRLPGPALKLPLPRGTGWCGTKAAQQPMAAQHPDSRQPIAAAARYLAARCGPARPLVLASARAAAGGQAGARRGDCSLSRSGACARGSLGDKGPRLSSVLSCLWYEEAVTRKVAAKPSAHLAPWGI